MAKFFVKISLLLLIVGFVFVIVGQATSYWLVRTGFNRGLWRTCYEGAHQTKATCGKLDDRSDFDKRLWATRVMNILAIVTSFIAVILVIFYLGRNDGLANLRRIKAVIVLCIMSALLVFIGIAVYSARKNADKLDSYHYGWSFILTAVAGAVHFLVILPLLIEIRRATSLGAYESI